MGAVLSAPTFLLEPMKKINILIDVDKTFIPKAEYVFSTFCRVYSLECTFYFEHHDDIHIYYGNNTQAVYPFHIFHNQISVDFFVKKEVFPFENIIFKDYTGVNLPFLFTDSEKPIIEKNIISVDLIASAFYFLSCWQETFDPQLNTDKNGRYDFYHSLQHKGEFSEIPIVDYYFKIIADFFKIENKRQFSVFLSHDVDYVDFFSKDYLKHIYKQNFKRILKYPLHAIYKILGHFFTKHFFYNPYNQIKKIIKKEINLGFKSTFFLMTHSCSNDVRQNYFQDKTIVGRLLNIFKDSFVGLHGTKVAHLDENLLKEQWQLLADFKPDSYRNHFLCFDYQKTFKILENLGIKKDATLGYHEHIGFRAGISTPFYPYNLSDDREFKVLEIPLIIMDTTLFSPSKMNLSYSQAKKKCFTIIKHLKKVNGQLSLLWHNNSFDIIEYRWLGKLYWDLIKKSTCTSNV